MNVSTWVKAKFEQFVVQSNVVLVLLQVMLIKLILSIITNLPHKVQPIK